MKSFEKKDLFIKSRLVVLLKNLKKRKKNKILFNKKENVSSLR